MITLDEVNNLKPEDIKELYLKYSNSGLYKVFNILGLAGLEPVSAEGIYIYCKNDKKIYDFTAGNCVLNLGHNHPRILKARNLFNSKKYMEVWKFFPSPYLGALSKNLASILPDEINNSFFCNSGAEANEGALKIAQKFQGKKKNKIVYTDIGFHGRTHATLSVSGGDATREYFNKLEGCLVCKYDDADDFERVVESRKNQGEDICAIILESMVASKVEVPSKGYLKKIREICDKNNILMIIDEVWTGFGRTGKMFAFQYDDVVPDIITTSKSLGGGKASIAAYIVKDEIFKKAYGSLKDYNIHSTTYNGLGEECFTAIESLNIFSDGKIVQNSFDMGMHLKHGLINLQQKYPKMIEEVRGLGLAVGVKLKVPGEFAFKLLSKINNEFKEKVGDGIFSAIIINQLLTRYNILVSVHPHVPSQIALTPPLIIKKDEIDYFLNSLDNLLSKGWTKIISNFALSKVF